jgi:hypothetical protein
MRGATLLAIGSHYRDRSNFPADIGKQSDTRRQDTIIVADEDVHSGKKRRR